jgi:uncharacterized protein (DUF58 family)
MTAKLRAFLGGAVLLIGFGSVLLSPPLVELSIPVVVYLVLARIFAGSPHVEVSASRPEGAAKIQEGGRAEITIRASNKNGRLGLLRVEDSLPEGVKVVRGSRVAYTALGEGERAELKYTITADFPGSWVLGPVTITAEDGFGLVAKSATVELPYRLDVLPRLAGRPRFPFRPQRTKNWPGQVVSARPGAGQDFYGIRPYLASDPARSVNWKASARLDRMYTNQYMAELGAEAVIVVDKSYDSDFGSPPDSALNFVERCAAGVAAGLLLAGNRVGLVVFGERIYEVSPRTGVRQLERILVEIVRAEKGPVKTFPYLRTYLSHFFPRAAQVIVVSSLMNSDIVEPLLVLGAYRDVRVVSPTLFSMAPGVPRSEMGEAAMALLRLQRWTTIERVRKRAIVAEWDVRRPLDEALEQAMYPKGAVVAR